MAKELTYIYSDGTLITFKSLGPKHAAVITYGETLSEEIVKGQTFQGQFSFSADFDLLAETLMLSYNGNRLNSGLEETTLVKIDSPPFFPPLSSQSPPDPQPTSTSNFSGISNEKGEFKVEPIPSLPAPEGDSITVRITADGFIPKEVPVSKGDGSIKDSLGNISLTPEKEQLEIEKAKLTTPTKKELEEVSKKRKDTSYFAQKKLIRSKREIIDTLIPFITGLLQQFGISQLEDLLKQNQQEILNRLLRDFKCPQRKKILKIIKQKNKITRQLNRTLDVIVSTESILSGNSKLILGFQGVLTVAENIPPPYNPTPPGTLKKLRETVSFLQAINNSLLALLKSFKNILNKCINLLDMLDKLIAQCSEGVIDNEVIKKELVDTTLSVSLDSFPVVTRFNGFKIEVETIESPTNLERRRAIAKNSQGVVMLTGEPSYSSIDQILIEELIFYITQNDLKAD